MYVLTIGTHIYPLFRRDYSLPVSSCPARRLFFNFLSVCAILFDVFDGTIFSGS